MLKNEYYDNFHNKYFELFPDRLFVSEVEKNVRLAAYYLWLNSDCPNGRDLEFWIKAQKDLCGSTKNYRDMKRDQFLEHLVIEIQRETDKNLFDWCRWISEIENKND